MAVIEIKVYRFVGFVLDRFNLTDSPRPRIWY